MKRSAEDIRSFLHSLLLMGKALLQCGAETYRVEDTLIRMAKAYGASEQHVFVIPSTIVITLAFSDGTTMTQSRRIYRANKNDFTKLDALNALSRRFCSESMEIQELENEISAISRTIQKSILAYAASFGAASLFTIFFGGNLFDSCIAGCVGSLICLLQSYVAPICLNDVVFTFLASIISGFSICFLDMVFPVLHIDKIMIGDIMLLIPGVMATNSIRDILLRDTLSGIIRLIEALLLAGTLALGLMIALAVTGGLV